MKPFVKFFITAIKYRTAYIDLDGCLVRKMKIPTYIKGRDVLDWWMENLAPTSIVYHRLLILYLLRMCGVTLIIWTNRQMYHVVVTHKSLGKHMWLFACSYYLAGNKYHYHRVGPLMDDQIRYIHREGDWLVKQL